MPLRDVVSRGRLSVLQRGEEAGEGDREEETMTPVSDDMHSLESWLREKALEAHNNAMDESKDIDARIIYAGMRHAFNKTIAKIQSMRISQRPHVQGRI